LVDLFESYDDARTCERQIYNCWHRYTSLLLNPILSHFESLHMLLRSPKFVSMLHTLVSHNVPTNISYSLSGCLKFLYLINVEIKLSLSMP